MCRTPAAKPFYGSLWSLKRYILIPALLVAFSVTGPPTYAKPQGLYRLVLIPILGVTMDDLHEGAVVYVELGFRERGDQGGLLVEFVEGQGQFSSHARVAVTQGIHRAAKALGLPTDSWSVSLKIPHKDLTIYGGSLSAMVGVSVAALANGEDVGADRAMTGTIMPDGHIGPVGAVPNKVRAANHAHIRRVVVPDEQDPADPDWETPFLMHVSPVGSVEKAYEALTGQSPFVSSYGAGSSSASPQP